MFCIGASLLHRIDIALHIDAFHLRLGITQAGGGADRNCVRDLGKIVVGQRDGERADIFQKPRFVLGARDRHDIVALRQQPRQRQLARSAILLGRDRFDAPIPYCW